MKVAIAAVFLTFLPSAFAVTNRAVDGGFESGTLSAWKVLGDASVVGTVYGTPAPEGSFQTRLQASPAVTIQQAASFAQVDASLFKPAFPDGTRVTMIQQHIESAVRIAVRIKGFTNASTNPATSIFVIYKADTSPQNGAPVAIVNGAGLINGASGGGFAFQSTYLDFPIPSVQPPPYGFLPAGTVTIAIFEPSGNPQSSAALVDDVRVVGADSLTRIGVIPQIASGGNWRTRIVVTNTDTDPVPVRVRFWNEQGESFRLILSFPQTDHGPNIIASEVNRTLNVRESFVIDWQQPTVSTQVGWAEVLADGKVGAFSTFHYQQSTNSAIEGSVAMLTSSQTSLLIPFDNTNGYGTALAIVNGTSATTTTLSATVSDDAGNEIWQQPTLATVPGNGHVAFSLADLLNVTVGKRGVVQIRSSSGPIEAGVLSFGPFNTLTSTPAF